MKKFILIFSFIASTASAQNYNSILSPTKRDTAVAKVNLHLEKHRTLKKIATGLQITALLSAAATYYVYPKKGNAIIFVPLTIGLTSFVFDIWSAKEESKFISGMEDLAVENELK